jgi:glycosyltransferase involved in cell wall biosynthesis
MSAAWSMRSRIFIDLQHESGIAVRHPQYEVQSMKPIKQLFDPLNTPYYIYAPPYRENSGGVRALHYLCHALNLVGQEAYVVVGETSGLLRTPSLTEEIRKQHIEAGRAPVVIYPEVIDGNPMEATHVVRYLLNVPGALTGHATQWEESDIIYTHGAEIVPDGMQARLLQTPLINKNIFNCDGVDDSQRKGSLVWISRYLDRGGELQSLTADSTEISYRVAHRSPAELAALYRGAEMLYTYEISTACYEAVMCGCPVVYLPNPIMLPAPVEGYLGPMGTAWGAVPEFIAQAKLDVRKIPDIYQNLETVFWTQLEEFIAHTQSIVKAAPPMTVVAVQTKRPATKKTMLVFSSESPLSPCPQIRLLRPFAHLSDDWELIWGIKDGHLQIDRIAEVDIILLHRYTPGLLPMETLAAIFNLGKPVIYETDDLLNEMPKYHPQGGANWKAGIEYTVRRAHAVVVSTPYLAEKYRLLNPAVYLLPNYIDFHLFYRTVPRRQRDTITIGLLGTSIQSPNFDLVDASLRSLCGKYKDRIKIYFIGWAPPKGWENHPNTEFIPVIGEYEEYASRLRQMQWNIALVPLAADEFNRSKSPIKWLEYSSVGMATIFSDVPIYSQVVKHGENGLLASDSSAAWTEAITSLIEDPAYRYSIATTAQDQVRRDYTLKNNVAQYGQTYAVIAETPVNPEIANAVAETTTEQEQEAAAIEKPCMLVYSLDPKNSPCSHIRLWKPFQLLKDRWNFLWATEEGNRGNLIKNADVVVLHRVFVANLPRKALDAVFDSGKPVIYESDDLLNGIPKYHRDADVIQKEAIEYAVGRAHAVVVSTPYLAEKYRVFNPEVYVLPNYVDFDLFYRPVPAPQDVVTIGLLGTSLQGPNFALIDNALRNLSKKHGARLQIHMWGFKPPPGWKNHPHMTFIPVDYDYESYARKLVSLNWDIGLVPLAEDEFNLSKTPFKWCEYSSCGIASIFSDISVYRAVVEDGHTGLLVPDSPKAWGEAISSLIEDCDKRRSMAQTAQDQVRDEFNIYRNVDEYDRCYRELTEKIKLRLAAGEIPSANPRSDAGSNAPSAAHSGVVGPARKRLVVLSIESTWSPCPQIRFMLPFTFLQDQWELVWGIADGKINFTEIQRADLVVLHRFTPGLFGIEDLKTLFGLGKPIVYETDDLLNDMPDYHPQAADSKTWKAGIEYTVQNAQAVVVSTPFLADKYRAMNPRIHVLPNYLDFGRFYRPVPDSENENDQITIGLLGTSIQGPNFALVEAALRAVCERYPGKIKIHFVGWELPAGWENHPAVQYSPFVHEYQAYAELLLGMQWDIALVPLVDDDFNHSKSAIKWLEYAAAGIAPVFSDVVVYSNVVEAGRTGLLVRETPDAWLDALVLLIENPSLRRRIARTAQAAVRKHHSLDSKAAHYGQVYASLTDASAAATTPTSEAPQSEPPMPIRGVLLLDEHGDAAKVDFSLGNLAATGQEPPVVIVLTAREEGVPEWTETVRYVQVVADEYAAGVELLSGHLDFDWIAIMEAGTVLEAPN